MEHYIQTSKYMRLVKSMYYFFFEKVLRYLFNEELVLVYYCIIWYIICILCHPSVNIKKDSIIHKGQNFNFDSELQKIKKEFGLIIIIFEGSKSMVMDKTLWI